ncbi:SMI1/KNR4 family protein, partial [Streptomyces verrucosisporus]|uniref:SMI1/KNR4 family protein n=1 Tax=Streptomyces verrucosisporus TaxID=1695161 RepID=UPI001F123F90
VALPEELKALYRVVRAGWEDWDGDYEAAERVSRAVGCELLALEHLCVADVRSRPRPWEFAAVKAAVTPPDAAVQCLVGSPGWIVFGDSGGGDLIAVDLTPGPRGHTGQVIMLDHEQSIGADLLADSLTDLVVNGYGEGRRGPRGDQPPTVARVNIVGLGSVEAAAHPELEVLSIGVWEGEPLSLAPVTGLPRLRTLTAYPGTLADPLEIAKLTGLEFLKLGPRQWRALLDARAVPRGLSAAAIEVHGDQAPLPIVALANELLALWDRPPITRTVLEGHLGPMAWLSGGPGGREEPARSWPVEAPVQGVRFSRRRRHAGRGRGVPGSGRWSASPRPRSRAGSPSRAPCRTGAGSSGRAERARTESPPGAGCLRPGSRERHRRRPRRPGHG